MSEFFRLVDFFDVCLISFKEAHKIAYQFKSISLWVSGGANPIGEHHKCPVSKHAFSKPWPLSLKGPSSAVSVSYLAFSREYRCKRTSFIFALFCSISWHGSKRDISLHCVRINGPFLQRLVLKLAIREMLFSSGPQVVQPTFMLFIL